MRHPPSKPRGTRSARSADVPPPAPTPRHSIELQGGRAARTSTMGTGPTGHL